MKTTTKRLVSRKECIEAAKGNWQQYCVEKMLSPEGCPSVDYMLSGKARNYYLGYEQSFINLCQRLRGKGIVVRRTPGPRGGEWKARYHILNVIIK